MTTCCSSSFSNHSSRMRLLQLWRASDSAKRKSRCATATWCVAAHGIIPSRKAGSRKRSPPRQAARLLGSLSLLGYFWFWLLDRAGKWLDAAGRRRRRLRRGALAASGQHAAPFSGVSVTSAAWVWEWGQPNRVGHTRGTRGPPRATASACGLLLTPVVPPSGPLVPARSTHANAS